MKKESKLDKKKPKENITNKEQYELLKQKKNTRKNSRIKCNSLTNISATLFMFEKNEKFKKYIKAELTV